MLRVVGVDLGEIDLLVGFNGHPPLGVNATMGVSVANAAEPLLFQWAPTLGGECYWVPMQTHPLRGSLPGFNGHPPLGVNATGPVQQIKIHADTEKFQWAPTLGGECYRTNVPSHALRVGSCFNGHPPLGVNATAEELRRVLEAPCVVSMGTHPWG